MKTRASFVTLGTLAVTLSLATIGCLGRTGLIVDELAVDDAAPGVDSGGADTTVGDDSATTTTDGGVTTSPRDSGGDTGIDIFDVIPIPDSGPIGQCATCVASNCADSVNGCVNTPSCLQGLGCTVTQCLLGGGGDAGGGGGFPIPGLPSGFDLGCLLTCFNGDYASMLQAVSAFTCITGTCGNDCGGLLGGLGGGLPGAGGAGTPGGLMTPLRATTVEELRSLDPKQRLCVSPDAFDAWREPIQRSACKQGLIACDQ